MMLLNLLKSPHEDIDFLKQVRVSFKGYCHEILVKREKPKDIFFISENLKNNAMNQFRIKVVYNCAEATIIVFG